MILKRIFKNRDNDWTQQHSNVLIAGLLSWGLDAFDYFILVFVLTDVSSTFHISMTHVSFAIFLTLVFRPAGAIIFGSLAERMGRKNVLMINIFVFSFFELLSAYAPTLNCFLLFRVFYGMAMGGIWGVASSLVFETVPARSRGVVSGLFQAGYPFGYLLAAVLYGMLSETVSWRCLFLVGGVFPLLLIPFIYYKVQESPVWKRQNAKVTTFNLSSSLTTHWRRMVFLVALMSAFNFFSHGTQDLYPSFLKLAHGFSPQTVSTIAIAYSVASIVGGIFFGMLSEKMGRKSAIILASLFAILVIPMWAFSSTPFTLGAGAFIMQFAVQGAWGVVPAYLNEMSPSEMRAILPGFVYQLGNLIASTNILIQTSIAETYNSNYGLAISVVTLIAALTIFVLISGGRETKGVIL